MNEEFVNSDLEIEVDERELGLYLAIIFQKERWKVLELKHLDEVVPKRKHETAKSILMSTDEIIERSECTVSKFHPARKDPTREEVRRMMGVALEEAVKKAMRNQLRRQREGGAIGNKLTGAMANVYMSRWTRQLKCNPAQATEDIDYFEPYVLNYYVNDNNLVTEAIPPGYTLGNLSTRRFSGDGDVYKRASLGKRAPSFPPKSKLKQRSIFATATHSKPVSKA